VGVIAIDLLLIEQRHNAIRPRTEPDRGAVGNPGFDFADIAPASIETANRSWQLRTEAQKFWRRLRLSKGIAVTENRRWLAVAESDENYLFCVGAEHDPRRVVKQQLNSYEGGSPRFALAEDPLAESPQAW
jgi:hypothetical protein